MVVLQEKLHSPAERGFAFVIGSKALYDALKQYETRPKYQRLVIEYEHGEDPDDAYSSIAYEKGANFILYLGEAASIQLGTTSVNLLGQNAYLVGLKSSYHTSATMSTRSVERASRPGSGRIISMLIGQRSRTRKSRHWTALTGMRGFMVKALSCR